VGNFSVAAALHSGRAKKGASEHLQEHCGNNSLLNKHLRLQRGSGNRVRDAFLSSSILANYGKTSEGDHEDAWHGRQVDREEDERRRFFKDGGGAKQPRVCKEFVRTAEGAFFDSQHSSIAWEGVLQRQDDEVPTAVSVIASTLLP